MTKYIVNAILILLLVGCGNTAEVVVKQVPTLTHGSVALVDATRPWLVVNYWAQWCGPCRDEIPELNQMSIPVVGVDFDAHQGAQLQQVVEAMGIEFPVLLTDPVVMLQAQAPTVLPSTLLVDHKGHVRAVLTGPQTQDSILRRIAALAPQ